MEESEALDELLRALASRHRRQILLGIWETERGAGELAGLLGLAPATVSEHLKVLRKTGLATMRAEGTFRFYRTCPEQVRHGVVLMARAFPGMEQLAGFDTSPPEI